MRLCFTSLIFFLAVAEARPIPALHDDQVDRLERLYHKGFRLQAGVPVIRIRLAHGQKKINISSRANLKFLVGVGAGDAWTYRGGVTWEVSLEKVERGRRRFWVLAERFAGGNDQREADARQRWTRRGFATRVIRMGVRADLKGLGFGRTVASVLIEPSNTRREAERAARGIARRYRIIGKVFEQAVQRPQGVIKAKNLQTGAVVRAKRLLSVHAVGKDAREGVHVSGVRWRTHPSQKRHFEGVLHFLIGRDGRLMLVNEADVETIVTSVVPSETFPKADLAVLQTQAVIARGHVLANLGHRHLGEPYHLCAEPHCQAYTGLANVSEHTRRAVTTTRGEVLMHNHILVNTMYHSVCGGHTEAYQLPGRRSKSVVMPGMSDSDSPAAGPRSGRVSDYIRRPPRGAWCAKTGGRDGLFRWRTHRSGRQISQLVNSRKAIGAVVGIRVLRRGVGGRAQVVEYTGTDDVFVLKGDDKNRRVLGGLRSGLWIVTKEPSDAIGEPREWIFEGGGYGHGIGLCQHGAMGMSAAGKTYADILHHYYRQTNLTRLW